MERINLLGKKNYIFEELVYENTDSKTKVMFVKDCELKRSVVLKLINFDNDMQKKLILNEIQNQAYLEEYTDFIPKIYNVFTDNKNRTIYIEMQKIVGKSLRTYIDENRVREKNQYWYVENYELFLQICTSVEKIHRAKGFVHKDLKPENIIINRARKAIYVIDFGISGPGISKGIGTAKYMAPEQQLKVDKYHVVQATDVYALGQIAIEMFTGEPLVYGKELVYNPTGNEWLKKEDISNIGADVYPRLGEIINKAIMMNPKDRYINAGKLVEVLQTNSKKRKHNAQN